MKLNNLDVDWESDDAAWAAFPKPEEMYSEPPMVSVFPEPPPEPPLSGAPKVPVDAELYDAEARDRQTRALRALEQGGLDVISGMTQIRPHQALTQPTADAAELRQRRMLEDRAMLERSKATWEQSNDLMRNLIAMRSAGGAASVTGNPVIDAELAYKRALAENEAKLKLADMSNKGAIDLERVRQEGAANVADIKASAERDVGIGRAQVGAEARIAEEERKKAEVEARASREAERDRLAAASRGKGGKAPSGGATKGAGSLAEQKVALQRERMARGLDELELRDLEGNKHRARTRQEAIKAREMLANAQTMLDMLVPIKADIRQFGSAHWPTERKAKLQGELTNLWLIAKGPALYELGVIAGPDMMLLERASGDPAGLEAFISGGTNTLARLDAMEKAVRLKAQNFVKAQGGALPAGAPAAPSAAGTIAKLEAWISANPKHPRLGEAQSKLQALKSKAGAK